MTKTRKKAAPWWVYIIESENGRLYTGITNDLERRFKEHGKSQGAKFFRFSAPKKMLYQEKLRDRSAASKRECIIKKMTREQKLNLIEDIS
jgi:putative endonuclease